MLPRGVNTLGSLEVAHRDRRFTRIMSARMAGFIPFLAAGVVLTPRSTSGVARAPSRGHPASEMPDFFRAADALLVHIRPSEIADHSVPTKMLAYMAAGRPIVCAMPGAAAELASAACAGPVLPAGDAPAKQFLAHLFSKSGVIDEYERVLVERGRGTGREPAPPVPVQK